MDLGVQVVPVVHILETGSSCSWILCLVFTNQIAAGRHYSSRCLESVVDSTGTGCSQEVSQHDLMELLEQWGDAPLYRTIIAVTPTFWGCQPVTATGPYNTVLKSATRATQHGCPRGKRFMSENKTRREIGKDQKRWSRCREGAWNQILQLSVAPVWRVKVKLDTFEHILNFKLGFAMKSA